MSYLLHIDSSSLGPDSVSRRVAETFRAAWDGEVIHRDLAVEPVPHITAAGISARETDPSRHTPEQAEESRLQDKLIDEYLGAGAFLFTVPMYNLTMPSVFKAWLDQIIVVGRTARVPSSAGRPAVVISARGGGYGPGAPNHGFDYVVPTLEAILGRQELLGLDVSTIVPELTLAPVTEAMQSLLALHERSMTDAHDRARLLARAITAGESVA